MLTHREEQLLLLQDAWSCWDQEVIQDILLEIGPLTQSDYLFLEGYQT